MGEKDAAGNSHPRMSTLELSQRQRLVFGSIALAAGIGTMATIDFQPRQRRRRNAI